jgi:hypothetical protein
MKLERCNCWKFDKRRALLRGKDSKGLYLNTLSIEWDKHTMQRFAYLREPLYCRGNGLRIKAKVNPKEDGLLSGTVRYL